MASRSVIAAALLASALGAFGAAPAPAATVSIASVEVPAYRGGFDTVATASYAASPGEVNDVLLERDGDTLVVTDPGAAIFAGAGCDPVDTHSARCAFPAGDRIVDARLGDLEDRVRTAGSFADSVLHVAGVTATTC